MAVGAADRESPGRGAESGTGVAPPAGAAGAAGGVGSGSPCPALAGLALLIQQHHERALGQGVRGHAADDGLC